MLVFPEGAQFTTGACAFLDEHPSGDPGDTKVYVRLAIQGFPVDIHAMLDTGSTWSVLEPEVSEALGLSQAQGLGKITLSTRVGQVAGTLHNIPVTIVAEQGQQLEVDAVFFAPENWPHCSFIGYRGFLEKIRFAVDAQENRFYFGAPISHAHPAAKS
ncbi:hypothetical protein DYH09_25150 [bacterium CPR1]|nr:hypothetical protein [bacterium CPR1]